MPKIAVPLTDALIRRTKPAAKMVILFDGLGLYLEIQPNGVRNWRFRYRRASGNENLLSFGPYPEVSLAEAREARTEVRRLLRTGIDPVTHREMRRREALERDANTFEKLAREWHGVKQISWTPNYARNVLHRLESDVFPDVGRDRSTTFRIAN